MTEKLTDAELEQAYYATSGVHESGLRAVQDAVLAKAEVSAKEPDWARRVGLDCYPVAVLQDRYGGTYLGGGWLALAQDSPARREAVEGMYGDDCEAAAFEVPEWAAVGGTPNEAVANLYRKIGLAKLPLLLTVTP